jgi:hypothetical protein
MLSRFDDYPIHHPFHQHLHNVVRAKIGEKCGVGVLEQILIGPHAGYGFSGLVDGATAPGLVDGATAPGLQDGAHALGPQAKACS